MLEFHFSINPDLIQYDCGLSLSGQNWLYWMTYDRKTFRKNLFMILNLNCGPSVIVIIVYQHLWYAMRINITYSCILNYARINTAKYFLCEILNTCVKLLNILRIYVLLWTTLFNSGTESLRSSFRGSRPPGGGQMYYLISWLPAKSTQGVFESWKTSPRKWVIGIFVWQ